MFAGLNGWHLVIILAVILLLFGAAKLPALAKSMGQSARVFKGEMKAMKDEDAAAAANDAPAAQTQAPATTALPTPVQNTSADTTAVTPPHDAGTQR
ncbi:Sec-independent protein translocase subunit TatA [Microbacterium azadirachtae]|jgi:sec-independent protein translocase protein TatA|uniref:Sec-independent protein translocase protein TatA n=1 Tax=Microbacterium azadirachtae TaxID=582680 RepID=A0A0F0KFM6_9MICO|nr:Sec-independent protein translocase subunit TatA [Microbacterium azadirachtae]KJL18955.1 Sec-independent protein translocase protein TatA [Microbacterium azadirachtae]UXW87508.1 Sec-independent protein translocase subunit TatA [Microbacterium azadirachtae]SDL24478.1 sec-independent protein translocase protein TatA [Microbacterium azadirachtae]SEF54391.1 sec-independent protein translocase protein TatA [Microbacterium azadirachtae]SEF54648.1 sec-independent protein translocase protein TatA [